MTSAERIESVGAITSISDSTAGDAELIALYEKLKQSSSAGELMLEWEVEYL